MRVATNVTGTLLCHRAVQALTAMRLLTSNKHLISAIRTYCGGWYYLVIVVIYLSILALTIAICPYSLRFDTPSVSTFRQIFKWL